jgi:hypothetical protein
MRILKQYEVEIKDVLKNYDLELKRYKDSSYYEIVDTYNTFLDLGIVVYIDNDDDRICCSISESGVLTIYELLNISEMVTKLLEMFDRLKEIDDSLVV